MKDILIIGFSLILARYFTEFICSYIVYKKRVKKYKDFVDKYDLNIDLPKNFKDWRNFNLKMLEYQMNNDLLDYLFYLSALNENLEVE